VPEVVLVVSAILVQIKIHVTFELLQGPYAAALVALEPVPQGVQSLRALSLGLVE